MIKVIVSLVCLFWAGLTFPAQSQLSMTGIGGGFGGAAASFVGPGDVSGWSGFAAWFSCARAFNAAYAAGLGSACDIVDTATGGASCTLKLKANGFADLMSLSCVGGTLSVTTFCTVTHPAGCSVTKMYDQTGNGKHATQATLANMPTLNLSAFNSLPCPVWIKSNGIDVQLSLTMSQPLVASMVAFHIAAASTDALFADGGVASFFAPSANTHTTFAGNANQSVTVSDGALHAMQEVWDDANSLSAVYVDGSNLAENGIGTGGLTTSVQIGASGGGGGFPWSGTICEMGFDAISPNSTLKAAMNTNQHGANGYNF